MTDRPRTYDVLGNVLKFLTFPSEVNGKYSLVEAIVPAGAGAPPNHHAGEGEVFYMLDGEIEFHLDGETILAKPGDHVVIPEGAVHAFTGISPKSRMLIVNVPGVMHDAFFTGIGTPLPDGATDPLPPEGPPDVPALVAFASSLGMTIVTPEGAST